MSNVGVIRRGVKFDGISSSTYSGSANGVDINNHDFTILYAVKNLNRKIGNWRSPVVIFEGGGWTSIMNIFTFANSYFFRLKSGTDEYKYSTYRVPALQNEIVFGGHVYNHTTHSVKTYNGPNLLGEETQDVTNTFSFDTIYCNLNSVENIVYFVGSWVRSLTDDEIKQVYNYVRWGEGEIPRDGLVLWYDGDSIDESAGVWRDKSGNGNDGTFVGNVEVISNIGENMEVGE